MLNNDSDGSGAQREVTAFAIAQQFAPSAKNETRKMCVALFCSSDHPTQIVICASPAHDSLFPVADEITLRLWFCVNGRRPAGWRDGLESDLGRIVGFFILSRRGLITGCGAMAFNPFVSDWLTSVAHYAPSGLMGKT
jgi:hypothetical protein